MNKLVLYCAVIISAILAPVFVFAYVSPGTPSGYVNDFANIISEDVESSIKSQLQTFEASTTIEVAVVTVNSIDGDDVAVYANELFREWGIGKKGVNNGVLLLIAPNERKLRIEVGYGLEGVLTDLQSGFIIDNIITSEFKNGNYDGGIINGVNSIIQVVEGEQFDVPAYSHNTEIPGWVFELGFFIIILLIQFGAGLLASTKEWWHGGVLGGGLGLVVLYFFGISIGIISTALLIFLGLIFDYYLSHSYKKWKKYGGSRPWYAGGGSSGRGGGGFGGFGGGSSGGGGASGSW